MNERIRELAEQAWDSLIDEIGDVYREDGINWDFLHAYDKKFAQLIILDCLEICKQREQANLYGVKEALATIRERFEVEL